MTYKLITATLLLFSERVWVKCTICPTLRLHHRPFLPRFSWHFKYWIASKFWNELYSYTCDFIMHVSRRLIRRRMPLLCSKMSKQERWRQFYFTPPKNYEPTACFSCFPWTYLLFFPLSFPKKKRKAYFQDDGDEKQLMVGLIWKCWPHPRCPRAATLKRWLMLITTGTYPYSFLQSWSWGARGEGLHSSAHFELHTESSSVYMI